jgi:hypothetical protein
MSTPTTELRELPEEPTIDWLIDQIAPNPGNSPLLNFNKQRLRDLITASQLEARIDELDKELPKVLEYGIAPSLAAKVSNRIEKLEQQLHTTQEVQDDQH